MAFRRITKWAQDQDGPVVGGTNYEGRIYTAGTRTLASLFLDSAGSFAAGNPHSPNAGFQTSSTANMLVGDSSITVTSTVGFAVGDTVPIDGSAGRFYGVIRTVTDATHLLFTQTLTQMGGAATMNSGALVGGPEMYGHWQAYASDVTDYDFTLKNLSTSKEGPPEGIATLSTSATLAFQEEGVSTGAGRPTVNFIGGQITAADNAGANRVDVTVADNQTYITTAAESSLSNERVLGTTVIAKGTLAGRPAAGTGGYLYFATDGPGGTAGTLGALYRDTGAAWDLVATNSAVDVQTFTASGTWTKPTTFTPKSVIVILLGGGGGGGGGRGDTTSSGRGGGGGGGGGAWIARWIDPSALGATETVTVGAAGTAGAGGSGPGNGAAGGAGGNTTFGAHATAYGGAGGTGATNAGATGGGGGGEAGAASGVTGGNPRLTGLAIQPNNVSGGGGDGGVTAAGTGGTTERGGGGGGGGSDTGVTGGVGGGSLQGAGSGGGGGGVSNVNVERAGGAGGASQAWTTGTGGAGGAVGGGAGTAGTSRSLTGKAGDGGGGSGGKNAAGPGNAGGAGGAPGGGGGGGGGATTTGSTGGAGARGEALVYTV